MKHSPTITVGIPTCWSGTSLVSAVDSIRLQHYPCRIIVSADRTPISRTIRTALEKQNVEIIWNEHEGSQFKKLNQIIRCSLSDIFIFTQDDVVFSPGLLKKIVEEFQKFNSLTMLGIPILPLASTTPFGNALGFMIRSIDRINTAWRNGDNYLSASGRCLAFKTNFLKHMTIPDTVLNGDAYLYFEHKRIGGIFRKLQTEAVYIKPPEKLADQIGPSSRYQTSRDEMETLFHKNLKQEYSIPLGIIFHAVLSELFSHPFSVLSYFVIWLYTRIFKSKQSHHLTPLWSIDTSTKSS